MVRLLVDKGVELNRSLGPRIVGDNIIGLVCQQWTSGKEARICQLDIKTALLEIGAEPNWTPGPDRLRWVHFIRSIYDEGQAFDPFSFGDKMIWSGDNEKV